MVSRTDKFAELKRQLDVVDTDIALVNEWLDEAQGMLQTSDKIGSMLVPYKICA